MSRLVVLHAADLHLDAPFEGIGRTPAHVAAALRDASLGAWDGLVDCALARQVAAVLLAGGLCDGLKHGVRGQAHLRDGLRRLAAADIPVFIALGAHDPLDGFAAIPAWPPGVTVFPAGTPSTVPLHRDGHHVATVHGISARRERSEPGVPRFLRGDAPGPHLAVLNAGVAGHSAEPAGSTRYRVADLRDAGMDYWALGDAPTLDYLATGTPWIVYPGTPQGRGCSAPQRGPKGIVLVELEGDAVARVDFEPVDRVRCVEVELSDAADFDGLARLLHARAEALRELHPGRGLLLEARVDGAPALTRALRQPAARAALLHAVRRTAAAWEPFVWWVGVQAAPPREAAAAGDDLAAEIARCRAALAADPAQCARFLARRLEPLRDAWTADVDPREAGELLDEAAVVAADALHEDRE